MVGIDLPETIGGAAGLVVATVGADGEPRAVRAWATRVVADEPLRMRVVMSADDPVTVANLANGTFALTGADVRTFRSAQLKGRVVLSEPATADDVELMVEQSSLFLRAVHETDGNPIPLLERLLPATVVSVEFVVEEIYDQSPGPRAGSPVVEEQP